MTRPRSARERPDFRKSLVGFAIGTTRYALGVACVRQVINPLTLTAVPHAPPFVVGLADFRGEVIPVVDFRVYLGAPAESTRKTKWIVIDVHERTVALVVDAVSGVFGASGELRSAPVAAGGDAARCIVGVASHDATMVYVIEPSHLSIPLASTPERPSLPA